MIKKIFIFANVIIFYKQFICAQEISNEISLFKRLPSRERNGCAIVFNRLRKKMDEEGKNVIPLEISNTIINFALKETPKISLFRNILKKYYQYYLRCLFTNIDFAHRPENIDNDRVHTWRKKLQGYRRFNFNSQAQQDMKQCLHAIIAGQLNVTDNFFAILKSRETGDDWAVFSNIVRNILNPQTNNQKKNNEIEVDSKEQIIVSEKQKNDTIKTYLQNEEFYIKKMLTDNFSRHFVEHICNALSLSTHDLYIYYSQSDTTIIVPSLKNPKKHQIERDLSLYEKILKARHQMFEEPLVDLRPIEKQVLWEHNPLAYLLVQAMTPVRVILKSPFSFLVYGFGSPFKQEVKSLHLLVSPREKKWYMNTFITEWENKKYNAQWGLLPNSKQWVTTPHFDKENIVHRRIAHDSVCNARFNEEFNQYECVCGPKKVHDPISISQVIYLKSFKKEILNKFGLYLWVPSPIKMIWMTGLCALAKDVFGLGAIPLSAALFVCWRADCNQITPTQWMRDTFLGNGKLHFLNMKCPVKTNHEKKEEKN